MASLALHDRQAPDEAFERRLPLVAAAAPDDRNFVKRGVSWALRATGRRNATLRAAATRLARQLAESPAATSRWVGRDALRDPERVRRRA
jgi:3-methyladenine DNA glycosylase AlkD